MAQRLPLVNMETASDICVSSFNDASQPNLGYVATRNLLPLACASLHQF